MFMSLLVCTRNEMGSLGLRYQDFSDFQNIVKPGIFVVVTQTFGFFVGCLRRKVRNSMNFLSCPFMGYQTIILSLYHYFNTYVYICIIYIISAIISLYRWNRQTMPNLYPAKPPCYYVDYFANTVMTQVKEICCKL